MTRTITLEVQVSDWANYVATAEDGDVFEMEYTPYAKQQWRVSGGKFRRLATVAPPADWTKTLRRITEDGRLVEV